MAPGRRTRLLFGRAWLGARIRIRAEALGRSGGVVLRAVGRAGRRRGLELVDLEGGAEDEVIRVGAVRHPAGLPLDRLHLGRAARVVLALERGDSRLELLHLLEIALAGRAAVEVEGVVPPGGALPAAHLRDA